MDTPDDMLKSERRNLRQHIGLGPEPGDPPSDPPAFQPLFFIELAPPSNRGSQCRLPTCTRRIQPGELRFALNPGMRGASRYRTSSYLYHLPCFEQIADFSQIPFLDQVQPLTRNNWGLRGLNASAILDGNYMLPGGVERLVLEWKVTRGKWIDIRDGNYKESRMDADFDALLHKAGLAEYSGKLTKPPKMGEYEYHNLLYTLAPYESDGVGEEWNLFESYLDATEGAVDNPCDLSGMLGRWMEDVDTAWKTDGVDRLGEKAARALKRLSAIPHLEL
ncbi:hypothetical protein MW887_002485 [Aspergillus wentii]|nr:hypothetical protein MW887_002485 [Aspergillus wentii]